MPAPPRPRPGRHRRLVLAPGRTSHARRAGRAVGWVGSVLTLSALALLGVAVAASLLDATSAPTITVTFDGNR
jgi:hypothetical protein